MACSLKFFGGQEVEIVVRNSDARCNNEKYLSRPEAERSPYIIPMLRVSEVSHKTIYLNNSPKNHNLLLMQNARKVPRRKIN